MRAQLVRHQLVHSGLKPFNCPYCTYRSAIVENLRKHCMAVHKLLYPPKKRDVARTNDFTLSQTIPGCQTVTDTDTVPQRQTTPGYQTVTDTVRPWHSTRTSHWLSLNYQSVPLQCLATTSVYAVMTSQSHLQVTPQCDHLGVPSWSHWGVTIWAHLGVTWSRLVLSWLIPSLVQMYDFVPESVVRTPSKSMGNGKISLSADAKPLNRSSPNLRCAIMSRISSSKQESLVNAKVGTRQQCVYEASERRNRRRINTRNIMLKSTFSGLQYSGYFRSFSCTCLPNLRNSPKNWTYSTSRSSKVIDLGVIKSANATSY